VLRALRIPLLLPLLALACASPEPGSGAGGRDPVARGEELYRTHGCVACHGAEGRGDGLLAGSLDPKPRDLRDPSGYRQGHSAEEISRTIGMGLLGPRVSPMPSYPHLSRADKDALAAWVVTLQAAGPAPPRVLEGWVRAAPPAAAVTAAYLTIENPGARERVLESVSVEGFETVEIHETFEEDGRTGMRPVTRLVIPPGGRVELAPGGVHLMLIGPEAPAREGEERRLTLRFADGSVVEAPLPVRRSARGES